MLSACLTLIGEGPPKPLPLAGQKYAVSASTEPISGVALVSWVSKPGSPKELDLAVIWRGRPGWYMEGTGQGGSGGATSTTFQQTIKYGGVHLSFQFVTSKRQLVVQDGPALDLGDANVVLVDHVTEPAKLAVVSKLTIPSMLTGPGELVVPFGRSNEIFNFLQCDVEVPQVGARPIVEALCRELRAANKAKLARTGLRGL